MSPIGQVLRPWLGAPLDAPWKNRMNRMAVDGTTGAMVFGWCVRRPSRRGVRGP